MRDNPQWHCFYYGKGTDRSYSTVDYHIAPLLTMTEHLIDLTLMIFNIIIILYLIIKKEFEGVDRLGE